MTSRGCETFSPVSLTSEVKDPETSEVLPAGENVSPS